MMYGLLATTAFLTDNPQGNVRFLAYDGIAALSGCMHDYNIQIKLVAIKTGTFHLLEARKSNNITELFASDNNYGFICIIIYSAERFVFS